jgi:hypothetical protein
MKKLLPLPLVAFALTGCASPVLMKDPRSGQIAQCYAPSLNVVQRYYERDRCVEDYARIGWVRVSPTGDGR